MKLDRSALFEIAQRLRESKKMLERTHERISNSWDGLQTLPELVEKATRILHDPRNKHSFTQLRNTRENQDPGF